MPISFCFGSKSGNSTWEPRSRIFAFYSPYVKSAWATIGTMEASAAVAVRDLRKVYGNKAAVDGLTLTVPQGCFFGFLGPNGAGKTTTIRMLMGLAQPTSGEIELLGLRMPQDSVE